MSEMCPLREGDHTLAVPSVCYKNCAPLWAEATGSYDDYRGDGHYEDCADPDGATLDNSHDAIHALKGSARVYVLVDECTECGNQPGEQAFEFTCPNSQ